MRPPQKSKLRLSPYAASSKTILTIIKLIIRTVSYQNTKRRLNSSSFNQIYLPKVGKEVECRTSIKLNCCQLLRKKFSQIYYAEEKLF